MDEEKVGYFIATIEIAVALFVVSTSIALGILFAPWVGFLAFSAFTLAFITVMLVSFMRSQKDASGEGES